MLFADMVKMDQYNNDLFAVIIFSLDFPIKEPSLSKLNESV